MGQKLAIYPEITGSFIIAQDKDIMTGFMSFNEAHAYAMSILSGNKSFRRDSDISGIKIDRRSIRAVLSRIGDRVEEKRYITESDGSVTIETEEHPIQKTV